MNKLRTINPEQLASLFRTLLQVLGGYLVAKGYLADGDWTAISGALLVLLPTIWGVIARSDTNLIKSAASVPAVEKVVAPTAEAATKSDYPKVTTS